MASPWQPAPGAQAASWTEQYAIPINPLTTEGGADLLLEDGDFLACSTEWLATAIPPVTWTPK